MGFQIPGVAWPLLAPDGTAGAPSYSLANSPTTGFYRAGADILGVSVAGTARARFTTQGLDVGTNRLMLGSALGTVEGYFVRAGNGTIDLKDGSDQYCQFRGNRLTVINPAGNGFSTNLVQNSSASSYGELRTHGNVNLIASWFCDDAGDYGRWCLGNLQGRAAPVARTLLAEGSRVGTDTNVAGANLKIQAGRGTGNAAASKITFEAPVAVASGSGGQTMTEIAAIKDDAVDFVLAVDGAAAQVGTLTNAPTAGNPTIWLKVRIGGNVRYIPAWS